MPFSTQLIINSFVTGSIYVLIAIGSFYGAIIAAYLLGFSENIGVAILSELSISTGYRPAIAFVILIILLILRPSGIMGKKEET